MAVSLGVLFLAAACEGRLSASVSLPPRRADDSVVQRLRGGDGFVAKLNKPELELKAALPKFDFKAGVPKVVDAVLAGLGLFSSLAVLGALEPTLGLKLVCPPMMASGVIFFAGADGPPDPKGFLSGTVGCSTVSAALLRALSGRVSVPAAQGAAAGALLVWYKMTGVLFPPAAVLSVLMLQAGAGSMASFILFPWLAGHVGLYTGALGVSALRHQVQLSMAQSRITALGSLPDEELKKIFARFDTSKDGFLDPTELRLALRVATNADVDLDTCKRMIAATDKNGDGVVDFKEFRAITKGNLKLP